ncbi:hypothetical protein Tco_0217152 [Tanacetum coccineum]
MKRVNTFVDYRTELVEEKLEQESVKKQKVDEVKETAELQGLIEVIPDEEEVAIDVVPLATKPPTIVDWKIHKEGKKSYYQIIRVDGKSQIPVEDLDLILYGDLKTMFEPRVEDQLSMKKLEILKKNIKFRGGLLGLKDFLMILELLLLSYYCSKIKTAERISTVRERIKTEERKRLFGDQDYLREKY